MKIIVNPRAGHRRGNRNLEKLNSVIRRRGFDCTPIPTEYPGHATELARSLAEESEPRIGVVGGDGTIAEVVNGIVESDTELGIASVGTGNDVARSLDLPVNDVEAALEIALGGEARPIDFGRERDRDFISVLGLGFPAIVADEANAATWLKGSAAFFVAVYKALHRLEAVPLEIELDDRTIERKCVAVMVQNTPYTGGGLHMAPEAELNDGLFDVVVVDDIGRFDLMVNFPKAYRGRHLEHPSFTAIRSRSVKIRTVTELPKMFDGDLCGTSPVEAEVVPGGVRIAVPQHRG
jgi:diacylglycerol kinase (ATP)